MLYVHIILPSPILVIEGIFSENGEGGMKAF